jgi:hypothetical protein
MNVHRNRKVGIHLEAAPNVLRIRVARRANKRSPEGGSPSIRTVEKIFSPVSVIRIPCPSLQMLPAPITEAETLPSRSSDAKENK